MKKENDKFVIKKVSQEKTFKKDMGELQMKFDMIVEKLDTLIKLRRKHAEL